MPVAKIHTRTHTHTFRKRFEVQYTTWICFVITPLTWTNTGRMPGANLQQRKLKHTMPYKQKKGSRFQRNFNLQDFGKY